MEDPTAAVQTPVDERPSQRRDLLSRRASIVAGGGLVAALASCGSDTSPLANFPTPTPTPSGTPTPSSTATPTILPVTDTDMLVLMLQLHYLQAEYYSRAVLGQPLPASLVAGAGATGDVAGPRTVTFADGGLRELVAEIAFEKIDQVVRLRAVLGASTPARPALNLGVDAAGSFTKYGIDAALAATAAATAPLPPVITDVYADQIAFLLGAFILEDAVMVAWRGIATLMTSTANIDVAAGLMATSSFHVGTVRRELFVRGNPTGAPLAAGLTGAPLHVATVRLSDLRDSYAPVDDDRGVFSGIDAARRPIADINPADGEGEVYGRLPNLTINVFYMTRLVASSGGFFPSGLNGVLRESAAT